MPQDLRILHHKRMTGLWFPDANMSFKIHAGDFLRIFPEEGLAFEFLGNMVELQARGKLQPADMTNSGLEPAKPKPMNKVQKRAARAKAASDLAKGWHPAAPCSLPDGCVNEAAKTNFLHAKFVPSRLIFLLYWATAHCLLSRNDAKGYCIVYTETSRNNQSHLPSIGEMVWPLKITFVD